MKRKLIFIIAILASLYVGFAYAAGQNLGQGRGCQSNNNNAAMLYQPDFAELDVNADGQVNKQEFTLFRSERQANRPGRGCNARYQANTFAELDLNGDAVISRDEFQLHQRSMNRN